MSKLKCKNCDKNLSGKWKNFCSRKCGSLFFIKNNHKETDIELKLREWLEANHIQYKSQISIGNISVPDFVLGKILIYADGDFWHSKPRRQYLDARINKRLEMKGYTVLRFKGSDIHNNFDKVATDICQHIQKANNVCSL